MSDGSEFDEPFDFSALADENVSVQHFDAGEKIFLEDQPATAMYVVRSGRVDIITYGTILENVGPGGLFGELSLIDEGARSAAAIAIEPTEVMAIDKATFARIIAKNPAFALQVMRLLAKRIRRMNRFM